MFLGRNLYVDLQTFSGVKIKFKGATPYPLLLGSNVEKDAFFVIAHLVPKLCKCSFLSWLLRKELQQKRAEVPEQGDREMAVTVEQLTGHSLCLPCEVGAAL